MSYKTHYLNRFIIYNWNQKPLKFLSLAMHLVVYCFCICIVMSLLLQILSFHFVDSSKKTYKQCNCILQEYAWLTLSAHWNACRSTCYWYTNALISTFGLHLTLNWAEIRSRSHVSASNVTCMFKIHWLSNHCSVYSSFSHFRTTRSGAETRTKTHRHAEIFSIPRKHTK